ncbi:stage II sporulation protein P [Oceanobacillus piezotolerans]|uniref:Stage II sporulation protein P n=1 Tax=Oceanobacillus piezotolerans TaxID=2448030 RepID=A0A498DFR1_9BACI|nr:stage II sporulation protein P [Oceanobacillus piezotolerans]RLL48028.1 stage II sporulation protein P [Oceanobacillus piezotolerans]
MPYKYKERGKSIYKQAGLYLISICLLFILIGIFTTIQPAYRISSDVISNWTSDIDGAVFIHLFGMENKAFNKAFDNETQLPTLSGAAFEVVTSLKPNDPRSLLGNEIPGFAVFDNRILIAGEGTDYTNIPYESSPPLEEVLKDREAVLEEPEEKKTPEPKGNGQSTGDKDVVFIYNSHNRESFLPHLPGVTNPDAAHHDEVNITKVSEHLAQSLEAKGIGAMVDETDIIGKVLKENQMEYWQAYEASRGVVEEAFATNRNIQFIFDLHRDALPREKTTKEINGEDYGRVVFVVGNEHENYEKNFALATEIHNLLEEKYPGLSRGVIPQGGAGNNGVYNQDLTENALLVEFGGVENTLEELYRSAEALAEVFSEFYWEAEAVNADV